MTEAVNCPSCHGKGKVFAFVNTGQDSRMHYSGEFDCRRCNGSGSVPPLMLEWIAAGRAFRDARVSDGLLMGAVACRLGVTVPELSKAYNGMIDPAPLIAAWNEVSGTSA